MQTMTRFAFGPFLLDLEARSLQRDGQALPVAGRTLDTLIVLLQNRGRLLDKDELLSSIWPDTIVDEANLSQSIFTLRKLLGDTPKDRRYIATIAGRGYQFVAPVTELPREIPIAPKKNLKAQPESRFFHVVARHWIRRHQMLAIAIVAGVMVAGVLWFSRPHPLNVSSRLTERRLTFNSPANEVASAVVSRDGSYVAYSDAAGVHVRLLSTQEERLLPASVVAPAGSQLWVDSWLANGTELLGHSREPGSGDTMWVASIIGQASRELRANALGWDVSPDGTRIAFSPTTSGKRLPEIWEMDVQGHQVRKVLALRADEFLWSVHWSPDGKRLAFISMGRAGDSLQTCDLNGKSRSVVVSAPGLAQWARSLAWLPDGRIIYSRAEAAGVEANLWHIRMNSRTGAAASKAQRLTRWIGIDVQGLSASADGTRLILRKESYPSQVYLGEIVGGVRRVLSPRRLTNDEAADWATAWTRDSSAILFTSDNSGKWGVFKQFIASQTVVPLIEGRENIGLLRVSPDGAWVLYSEEFPFDSGRARGYRLMRIPVDGGPPRLVYEETKAELQDYPCAQSPVSVVCLAIEENRDHSQLLFSALDPLKGKGRLLRTVAKDARSGYAWALSPDGTVLALASGDQPEISIRLLSLTGAADREIAVHDWPNIGSMEWAADGKGLYCGSLTPQSGTLIYVSLQGKAEIVSQSSELGGGSFIGAVPSPDGRYLAMTGAIHSSNAWVLQDF